jgi:hypothetical protein
MPADAQYRQRRLSRVFGEGATLVAQRTSVTQPGDVNPMFPDLMRTFEPLEDAMVATKAQNGYAAHIDAFMTDTALTRSRTHNLQGFSDVLEAYRAAAGLHADAPCGVDAFAIRTLVLPGQAGEPAPEGIHRDGRRVLSIFAIGRARIAGGVTELYGTRADGSGASAELLFRAVLQPGEGVVVNDRVGGVFHYTTRVEAAEPPLHGARDVLLLIS